MRASILLNLEGISPDDVRRVIQIARDIEQKDPTSIHLKILLLAPDISVAQSKEILDSIRPPLPERMFIR